MIVTPVSSAILSSWRPESPGRISSDSIMTSWGLCLRKFHCKDHWAAVPDHKIQIYHVQCCPLISRGRRWSFSIPWCLYYISIGTCHLSHCAVFTMPALRNTCCVGSVSLLSPLFTVYVPVQHQHLTNIVTLDTQVVPLFLVLFQISRYYIAATLHC